MHLPRVAHTHTAGPLLASPEQQYLTTSLWGAMKATAPQERAHRPPGVCFGCRSVGEQTERSLTALILSLKKNKWLSNPTAAKKPQIEITTNSLIVRMNHAVQWGSAAFRRRCRAGAAIGGRSPGVFLFFSERDHLALQTKSLIWQRWFLPGRFFVVSHRCTQWY